MGERFGFELSKVNTGTAQSFRKAQNINEQHVPQELNHALCSKTHLSREAESTVSQRDEEEHY